MAVRAACRQATAPRRELALAQCSSCASQDGRGLPRPIDGDGDGIALCDIGAVERTPGDEFVFANGFD